MLRTQAGSIPAINGTGLPALSAGASYTVTAGGAAAFAGARATTAMTRWSPRGFTERWNAPAAATVPRSKLDFPSGAKL